MLEARIRKLGATKHIWYKEVYCGKGDKEGRKGEKRGLPMTERERARTLAISGVLLYSTHPACTWWWW